MHGDTVPETPSSGRRHADWPEEVKKLETRAEAGPDLGSLAGKAHIVVDLQPAYERLFLDQQEPDSAAQAEAVYETLERMPLIWQDTDVPVEHSLTTFDVVLRCGPEPVDASRNDWFTGSTLDSVAGHRALVQGQIPREQLIRTTPWHLDLSSFVRRTVPDLKDDVQKTLEGLSRYDLAVGPNRPATSYRRENEARSQLALDLTLASDVFVPKRPGKDSVTTFDEDMLNISRSTEAMSLGELEPPPVHFGFLRPIPKEDPNGQPIAIEDSMAPTKPVTSLGVRLLLQEWDVGTDPYQYVYRDPYDQTVAPPARAQRPAKPSVPTQQATQPVVETGLRPPAQSQRPPAIASSQPRAPPAIGASEPSVPRKPLVAARSHDVLVPPSSLRVLPSGSQPSESIPPPPSQEFMASNKAVVCALSASYISTFAGYPLDSIKSRLQTTRQRVSIPRLALTVYKEEGIIGFYRGLWIPLMTISFVRAASFTIYTRTKEFFHERHWLARNSIFDIAATGGISGALSGSLISFGSAPFELVKVRRQLEYTIAASKGVRLVKAPSTMEAVRDIFRTNGILGLYTGFRLHFVRDTMGTALYFFEYDGFRYIMGRNASGAQGDTPPWLPIPVSLVPFMCGSLAGVSSWALIYPLDVVKTKVQQRALAGEKRRGVMETFHRLIRGPDPNAPKPILLGLARLYRGLGVSALRSVTTHGLLWTLFDLTGSYIDRLPGRDEAQQS
ncbi:hypothetical protein BN946_scf185002.g120 [Trametes cinnabarina]|uniref:Mitochondrial carrier n=1 Tax=Pycnoporus cinnabarinus TaxID=5643 RepID=A0A060SEY6_PYCCI|nr:hypothetical protein BN946_scf185002.g120 [Trametes cinnabarina]